MEFSLDQLEAFRATADTGSFSAAARRLGKAQSVISTAVANLEVSFNLPLFDRSKRYPTLTDAGERLLAEASLILDRCQHMQGLAMQLSLGAEDKLALAIDDLMDEDLLSRTLSDFQQRFPNVQLELLLPMMEDISRLVLDGRVDIGLAWQRSDPDESLAFRMVQPASLVAVAASSHPLAKLQQIEWEDLKCHRQLLATARGGSQEKNHFRVAADVWWVESHWVMLKMTCHNIGWALLPQHIANEGLKTGQLQLLNFAFGKNQLPIGVELVWHKQKPLGPAAQWLIDHLSQAE